VIFRESNPRRANRALTKFTPFVWYGLHLFCGLGSFTGLISSNLMGCYVKSNASSSAPARAVCKLIRSMKWIVLARPVLN
jgi:hypothetical protein